MNTLLNGLSTFLARASNVIRQRKYLVTVIFAGLTALLFQNLSQLKFDFTIDGWFDKNDPTFVAYNEFNAQFGSQDGVLIVYKPIDGDVFSEASLKAAKGIRDELLGGFIETEDGKDFALSHIVDVKSLVNAPVLTARGDVLVSRPLVGDAVPSDKSELETIRALAQEQPEFELQYFSKDMKYGGIYIKTDFGAVPFEEDELLVTDTNPDKDMIMENMDYVQEDSREDTPRFKPTDVAEYYALNESIKHILAKPEYAEHFEYFKVGNTIDSENQAKIGKEMGMLYLMALVIMIVLLWLLFRSFSGVIWPLLIIVLTAIWTLALAVQFGLSATPLTICVVLLILTIGMADAVHIISGYLYFRREGEEHGKALELSYKKAGVACFLTSLTTMVGLMSLSFSYMVPIKGFAIMSTTGVGVAFILTIFLLPAMLEFWAPVSKSGKDRSNSVSRVIGRMIPNFAPFFQTQLNKVIPLVEKAPVFYVIPFVLLFVVCLYGSTKIHADYNLTDAYAEGARFRQSIELIDDKMAGSGRISVYFDLDQDNAIHDPKVLKVIEGLQQKFETEYSEYVVTTSSIVDVVKDANQKLNGGGKDMYKIPESKSALSQTLFLFNIADPDERATMVDEYYRKASVLVTVRNYGSYAYTDVFKRMKKDIDAATASISNDYPKAQVSVTGFFAMGMRVAQYVIVTQLESYGLAILVISIILLLVFSSLKAGIISLIPNLIPSFIPLGILGIMGTPLDFYTMMLAPIVIGISVDDTIHFITQYRKEVLIDGNIHRALKSTINECGQAVVFTSLILGLGFGIMATSSMPGYANLGKFGFICIFTGLLNDLFLTPALILLTKMRFNYKETVEQEPVTEMVSA